MCVNVFILSVALLEIIALIIFLCLLRRRKSKSTDNCPSCGKGVMCAIRSQQIKMCSSCAHTVPWELKPGQLPLVTNNRQVKRSR